jgi:hypothetical protein
MAGKGVKLILVFLPAIFFGCASQPKKISYDQRVDHAINSIITGNAVSNLDLKKNKPVPEEILKLSTYARYGSKNDLIKSSVGYLSVDKQISGWEKTTSQMINSSLSEFITYSFGSLGGNSPYIPRPFESTMLSFNLALNHSIAGRNDLAFVEARKIIEKEKFIERLNQKTIEAIREQEKTDYKIGPMAKPLSKIEMIEDYPIEIFKLKKNKLEIKKSYQSAAANFLAGFIFEAEGDNSLASPSYINALEIIPNSKLFSDSLKNLGSNNRKSNSSEVLFIFEVGLVPKLTTKKYRYDVLTKAGQRFTSITLPTISDNETISERLGKVFVNHEQLNTELTSDISQILVRELKDSMPKYLAMATSKALLEISSQISVAQITKGMEKNDSGLTRLLASALVAGIYSRGEIDVRTWDTLPETIYMARAKLPYGEHYISFQENFNPKRKNFLIDRPYQIINIRILDRNTFLATNRDSSSAYLENVLSNAR